MQTPYVVRISTTTITHTPCLLVPNGVRHAGNSYCLKIFITYLCYMLACASRKLAASRIQLWIVCYHWQISWSLNQLGNGIYNSRERVNMFISVFSIQFSRACGTLHVVHWPVTRVMLLQVRSRKIPRLRYQNTNRLRAFPRKSTWKLFWWPKWPHSMQSENEKWKLVGSINGNTRPQKRHRLNNLPHSCKTRWNIMSLLIGLTAHLRLHFHHSLNESIGGAIDTAASHINISMNMLSYHNWGYMHKVIR